MLDKFEGFETELVQSKTFQGRAVILSAPSAKLCSLTTSLNKQIRIIQIFEQGLRCFEIPYKTPNFKF